MCKNLFHFLNQVLSKKILFVIHVFKNYHINNTWHCGQSYISTHILIAAAAY